MGFVMEFTKTPESDLFVRIDSTLDVNDIATLASQIGEWPSRWPNVVLRLGLRRARWLFLVLNPHPAE